MNNYSKLIKSKTLSFSESLIKNYHLMGLNEIECVILIKLSFLIDNKYSIIDIKNLSNNTSLTENKLSTLIMSLVERGFIELKMANNREEFSIDKTIDKLGKILESNSDDSNIDTIKCSKVDEVTTYFEQLFNKPCMPSDLLTINTWITDDISIDLMKDAIKQSAIQKKFNIRYADAIIKSKKPRKEIESSYEDDEIAKILNSTYVK